MYPLFILLVLFSGAIGFGLAGTNANIATVFVFSFLAMIVLQFVWVLTLYIEYRHG